MLLSRYLTELLLQLNISAGQYGTVTAVPPLQLAYYSFGREVILLF
jgi:hypothetical protein